MYSDWADVEPAPLSDVPGRGVDDGGRWGTCGRPAGTAALPAGRLTVVYGTPQPPRRVPRRCGQVDVYAGHLRGDFGADDTLRLAELSATPADRAP